VEPAEPRAEARGRRHRRERGRVYGVARAAVVGRHDALLHRESDGAVLRASDAARKLQPLQLPASSRQHVRPHVVHSDRRRKVRSRTVPCCLPVGRRPVQLCQLCTQGPTIV